MNRLSPFLCCLALVWTGCRHSDSLYKLLPAQETGVVFNNVITETDSLNIFTSEFIYNGGGVAIGDFNGDQLEDLYFTGNQVGNALYLNRGQMHFEDITEKAGAQKRAGQWSAGVNIVDLNADGKKDIYVCNTFVNDPEKRRNLLFINTGNDAQGIPHFEEMAKAYGVDDTTHSANAQFFDYDNDGDLDLFIGTNFMDRPYPNRYTGKITDGSAINRDRLYRNDPNPALGHPVFTEVTREAGLIWEGFSHSSFVFDFNRDGWPDIYVANDYVSNDLLYINNQNGSFTNRIADVLKHQPASAMGCDMADVNNDGQADLFVTEMLPYYNKRKKLFLDANNYSTYANNESYHYEYQYTRNMLQLNRGIEPVSGQPLFSDVAFYAGVQETEWSWSPLLADLDNDGLRDLFITNGFPRDVTDHDFGAYRSQFGSLIPLLELQESIPQIKSPKFAFRNEGQLRFSDRSKAWGLAVPAFSNGSACGDLDNDGDLDLVVNNIDDPAFVFENTLNQEKEKPHYLRVKLHGPAGNPDAFGAQITACWNGQQQTALLCAGRGYLSASENIAHFGLGAATGADSLIIRWDGKTQTTLARVAADQVLEVRYEGSPRTLAPAVASTKPGLLSPLAPASLGLDYTHLEADYADFNLQRTLPYKFSAQGPAMAVGDVNGDGLEDVYLGGASQVEGSWLIQGKNGRFTRKNASYKETTGKHAEETGVLLFDADGDGDNDLYLTHGSYEFNAGSPVYQDVLCVNDGKGNFTPLPAALPQETANGQCVKAADMDGDGDLDLFVGARVLPAAYPKPDRSFLLRNDTPGAGSQPRFTDVTAEWCPELAGVGLVSDALWTDYNGDNRPDLIVAGEWMPLVFFENTGKSLKNATAATGIADQTNWWTSLAAGDLDNDGDMDYVAGSFGENLYFQAHPGEPLRVYAKDFDNNGAYDPFISCYWQDSTGVKREYFYHTRDDMVKQLLLIRRKFNYYGQLGERTAGEIFSKEELSGAQVLTAVSMQSCWVENKGKGTFALHPLPWQAQLAPVRGLWLRDLDQDGRLDIVLTANDFGLELLQGRADASNGLILKNTGNGQFAAMEMPESHFCVPYDARGLAWLPQRDGSTLLLAPQNRQAMKVFQIGGAPVRFEPLMPSEVKAVVQLKSGGARAAEFARGGTYLSQDPRRVVLDAAVKSVVLYDRMGKETRTIQN